MPDKSRIRKQISLLESAYTGVQAEKENAKAEQKKVTDAFGSISKWKGNVYNTVKQQETGTKYSSWIGSIDRLMNRLTNVINGKRLALQEIEAEERYT